MNQPLDQQSLERVTRKQLPAEPLSTEEAALRESFLAAGQAIEESQKHWSEASLLASLDSMMAEVSVAGATIAPARRAAPVASRYWLPLTAIAALAACWLIGMSVVWSLAQPREVATETTAESPEQTSPDKIAATDTVDSGPTDEAAPSEIVGSEAAVPESPEQELLAGDSAPGWGEAFDEEIRSTSELVESWQAPTSVWDSQISSLDAQLSSLAVDLQGDSL